MKINIINIAKGDSSNKIAHQLAEKNKPEEITVVNLLNQTKGKGRGNNRWFSEYGKSLTFSIIVYPDFLTAEKSFYLSKLTSIAIVQELRKYSRKIQIKWPNDIYYDDKKLGGILIENSFKGQFINYSIIGIGLNVNQTSFPENLPNPISLFQITDNFLDIEKILDRILYNFKRWYNYFKNNYENPKKIKDKYFSYLKGTKSYLKYKTNDNKIIEGKIISVDENGFVNIQILSGSVYTYAIDDIELIT